MAAKLVNYQSGNSTRSHVGRLGESHGLKWSQRLRLYLVAGICTLSLVTAERFSRAQHQDSGRYHPSFPGQALWSGDESTSREGADILGADPLASTADGSSLASFIPGNTARAALEYPAETSHSSAPIPSSLGMQLFGSEDPLGLRSLLGTRGQGFLPPAKAEEIEVCDSGLRDCARKPS